MREERTVEMRTTGLQMLRTKFALRDHPASPA
jgi:hypothetical protein